MAIPGESMRILDGPITKKELKSIAADMFGDLVKGVDDEAIRDKIAGIVDRWVTG